MTKLSRKQEFISKIEHNILSGKWKAGDKIPTERELVTMYGASRTVVNAALSELEQKGFLNIKARQWTQVADYKRDGTLAVLSSIMFYNGDEVDYELLQSMLDARLLVECESVVLAAQNADEDDIKAIEDIIRREMGETNISTRCDLDYSFHHAVSVAGKNIVYPLIINSFATFAKKYLEMFYRKMDDPEVVRKKHLEILEAIKRHDEKSARDMMYRLLKHGEQILKN